MTFAGSIGTSWSSGGRSGADDEEVALVELELVSEEVILELISLIELDSDESPVEDGIREDDGDESVELASPLEAGDDEAWTLDELEEDDAAASEELLELATADKLEEDAATSEELLELAIADELEEEAAASEELLELATSEELELATSDELELAASEKLEEDSTSALDDDDISSDKELGSAELVEDETSSVALVDDTPSEETTEDELDSSAEPVAEESVAMLLSEADVAVEEKALDETPDDVDSEEAEVMLPT